MRFSSTNSFLFVVASFAFGTPLTSHAQPGKFPSDFSEQENCFSVSKSGDSEKCSQEKIEAMGTEILYNLGGDDVQTYLGFNPKLKIVSNRSPNAFITDAGQITVSAGLIELLNSKAEFAFVLAHELSHGILNHRSKRSSLVGSSLSIEALVELELAADRRALQLLKESGYETGASLQLLSKIAKLASEQGLEVERTLPSLKPRINALSGDL